MKRILTISFLVFMITPAFARDMNGKFGLGLEASTGGVSGLQFSYFINVVKLELTLGSNIFIPEKGDTAFGFYSTPGLIAELVQAPNANLGVGLKANLGYRNKAAQGNGYSVFEASIEVPIEGEYFLSNHFGIHFSVGFLFDIVPKGGRAMNPMESSKLNGGKSSDGSSSDKKGFGIYLGAGSFSGSAGFTFYF